MAIMTDADRVLCWIEWMKRQSTAGRTVSVTKADIRAFLNAADQWASDNQAAYNTAIPQPARNALTTQQKVEGLVLVLEQRFLVGA